MDRNLVIFIFFLVFATALFLSSCSCTCHCDDDYVFRGCGYEYIAMCQYCDDCGYGCLDLLCPGEGIYTDYNNSQVLIAKEGIDYKDFSVDYHKVGSSVDVEISVNVLKKYDYMKYELECYLLQDGNYVGKQTFKGRIYEAGEFNEDLSSISLNKYYNPNGGEVVLMVNSFYIVYED